MRVLRRLAEDALVAIVPPATPVAGSAEIAAISRM